MQYDNKYDLDHNDCPEYENETPEEFASDFVVETDTDSYDEFTSTPDEYSVSPSDEQVSTTDLSDLYESDSYDNESEIAPHPTCNDDSCNINYETAQDNANDSVSSNAENSDKPVEYVHYPDDEQAATLDDCYCGDTCGCGSTAQEKCQLDDYEIISDVLGSEKQIVKLYSTALCETAEENLRDIIRDNFTEAAADQFKVFSYMQENGMYKTEQASEAKILEAKQQFTPLCRNNCINND
ncbi:MAG: spore coat protein [Clostridiales bacterium]|nr:spore coat protein [Clostridiales bacterium]